MLFVATILTLALLGGFGLLVRRMPRATAQRAWLLVFTLIVAGGVSMMITHSFVTRWGIRTDARRDGLYALMEGSADRPFVFRRLAPELVRVTTELIAERLPAAPVDDYLSKSSLLSVYPPVPVMTRNQRIAVHAAFALVCLAWFGSAVAAAWLLRTARNCSWLHALVTASLALCLVPMTFCNGGYLYDSFEVLLWTTLLGCLASGWLLPAIPVFCLALINKESLLALVPALFPLLARQVGAKRAAAWSAAYAMAAAAWLIFIRRAYAHSPGAAQEWSLLSNLEFWSRPTSYLKFAPMFAPGLPAPRGGNLLILFLIAVPVRFGIPYVRKDLRWAALLAALALIPLFLLSGCIDETRALGPLFPLLLVIGSEGLQRLFQSETEVPQPG